MLRIDSVPVYEKKAVMWSTFHVVFPLLVGEHAKTAAGTSAGTVSLSAPNWHQNRRLQPQLLQWEIVYDTAHYLGHSPIYLFVCLLARNLKKVHNALQNCFLE